MSDELYVIYNACDKIYLSYVDGACVVDEFHWIDNPYVAHKLVHKSSFYTYMDGFMYGNDKEKLITKWNEYHKQQSDYMKIRMLQHDSYIIDKDDYNFIVSDMPKSIKN